MRFFVPGFEGDHDGGEHRYAKIAQICGAAVPAVNRRIYSIAFEHDGVNYTATVGHARQAVKYKRTRSGQIDYSRQPSRYSSGNRILAIFEGPPCYLVFQEPGPSVWANPAMCGQATSVTYFDA